MTHIDVVLPCLDEADALPWVLDRMPSGYVPIVVDNGSTDASAEIAARHGARVVHAPRRGFGEACHAGLRAATADTVCFMDADASLDPRDLPLLVAALHGPDGPRSDAAPLPRPTLVLGRRRPTEWRSWPPHARVANRVLARELNRRARTTLHDLGPMRAARRADLLALDLADRRFGYPLEMVLKAARADWRITELDVPYHPRTGRSKVTGSVRGTIRAVHDMRNILATVGAA
ncbi:glycosyltransferase family 2 protein [Actinomadura logoneensis]|uniref:Glycosyltransferase family 2 protein n=1 Tax=Actinomadura logoneensis TaxID=2293572 RepID=A0A372JTB5_9ACTN|nr:glycosyltransferase family 2 protein [Actinomadura logoneensis]RFU43261.1 glycosyltransferase family 2 protein [Actinomadura logoneensis]